ncbi:MAG: hypothetical protein QM736_15440, partial [Vicinamibacterales bacterium]
MRLRLGLGEVNQHARSQRRVRDDDTAGCGVVRIVGQMISEGISVSASTAGRRKRAAMLSSSIS